MDHDDHLRLLRDGIPNHASTWADFGSGTGAFTLALADLLPPQAEIFSIDRDGQALSQQKHAMQKHYIGRQMPVMQWIGADFSQPLDLPPLDGVVMANALHFHRHKENILKLIHSYLKPNGRLILVEYNVDRGNPWVPFPISYQTWSKLAPSCGFESTRLLVTVPSRFLGEIYSAMSIAPHAAWDPGSLYPPAKV